MPIGFDCPGCMKHFEVPDSAAGSKCKCPQCQTVFRVPGSVAIQPGLPVPAPSKPSPPSGIPRGQLVSTPGAVRSSLRTPPSTRQLSVPPPGQPGPVKKPVWPWLVIGGGSLLTIGLLVGMLLILLNQTDSKPKASDEKPEEAKQLVNQVDEKKQSLPEKK